MARSLVLATSLAFSLGCSEVETDEGHACLIPVGLTCSDCDNSPFTICSLAPQTDEELWQDSCTQGVVPADVPLRIEVNFGRGRGESWDLECSVEQTGDRELLIQGSWRWRPDGDADIEPDLHVACQTPPLSAGEWTIRYGQGEMVVNIGTSNVPLTCVYSGKK